MIVNIFSVYDLKIKAYRYPFFCPTVGQAKRAFIDLVNDGKSEPSRFSADFVFFHNGSFDDETGLVTPLNPPENLGIADSYKTGGN